LELGSPVLVGPPAHKFRKGGNLQAAGCKGSISFQKKTPSLTKKKNLNVTRESWILQFDYSGEKIK